MNLVVHSKNVLKINNCNMTEKDKKTEKLTDKEAIELVNNFKDLLHQHSIQHQNDNPDFSL